jgi:hypothetical protein
VRAGAREMCRVGREGGRSAGARGGEVDWNRPSREGGERISFFLSLISISISISFNLLFLLNKKLSIFSWVSKYSM